MGWPWLPHWNGPRCPVAKCGSDMSSLLARILGGLGRILITLGLLVLSFAAFQYWGTSLAEAQAQDDLDAEFLSRLAAVGGSSDEVQTASDQLVGTSESGLGGTVADTVSTHSGTVQPAMLDLEDIPRPGEAAGRIIIPSIGVDKTYLQGVDRDDLRKGPGHYPQTPLPGQPGNAAIAGHRTTYGAPFHDLDQLLPGDEIVVDTLQGRFTYVVEAHETDDGSSVGHFIVHPSETWVLDDKGDSRLTLTACHPKRSAAQRIIVTAVLDSAPAPATPIPADIEPEDSSLEATAEVGLDNAADDSFEESLGWQRQHTNPTLIWAAVTFVVGLAGWVLGRKWRPLPAYVLAAAPFAASLFACFTYLNKLLPAF